MFTREILKCPVGKEVLGFRHANEAAALTCKDCNFIYVWEPNNPVPLARKVVKHEYCDCPNCKPD